MRRLIAALYRLFFGIRVYAADIRVTDLARERAHLLGRQAHLINELDQNHLALEENSRQMESARARLDKAECRHAAARLSALEAHP